MTIVTDLDESVFLHVADDRKRESLDAFFRGLTSKRIAFDKFHVAIREAVDRVRRSEHGSLLESGDDSLKGSRYLWLTNPDNLDDAGKGALNALRQMNLKTSRAGALKETAMCLWRFVQRKPGCVRVAGLDCQGHAFPARTRA